jgi:hypothetical protein
MARHVVWFAALQWRARTSGFRFFPRAAWVWTLLRRGRGGVPDTACAKSKHREVIDEI